MQIQNSLINACDSVHCYSFQIKMPPENKSNIDTNFHTACDAILKNWTALQLAVSQGAGGPQSKEIAQWMVDAVVQWFNENDNLQGYEVTEFLEQIIIQEFNLIIDDGSSDEIGTTICEFYQLCTSSKSAEEILCKIRSLPKCDLSRCKIEGEQENIIIHDENRLEEQMSAMEVNNSSTPEQLNLQNIVNNSTTEPDPDGWTVVDRKKK